MPMHEKDKCGTYMCLTIVGLVALVFTSVFFILSSTAYSTLYHYEATTCNITNVSYPIELPTDELLRVIISKTLSEKQISINPKISDFIINNVERSYEKMFKFLKEVDELSLSTGKSININLIKKVLNR